MSRSAKHAQLNIYWVSVFTTSPVGVGDSGRTLAQTHIDGRHGNGNEVINLVDTANQAQASHKRKRND